MNNPPTKPNVLVKPWPAVTLSESVQWALQDFAQCLNTPYVTIDMLSWLTHRRPQCNLCLAGSVLYQRTDWRSIVDRHPEIVVFRFTPVDFDDACDVGPVYRSLVAIDHVRTGSIDLAIDTFYGRTEAQNHRSRQGWISFSVRYSPEWFEQMNSLVDELKGRSL